MKIKDPSKTNELVKEVVFLLWKAAGGTSGMGFIQDSPGADKEGVYEQAAGHHDYAGLIKDEPGKLYMDYVFGRCMKTNVHWNEKEGTIEISPNEPKSTYQDWGRKYKTANEAVVEAMTNLELKEAS